jgi:hypothetical protein
MQKSRQFDHRFVKGFEHGCMPQVCDEHELELQPWIKMVEVI